MKNYVLLTLLLIITVMFNTGCGPGHKDEKIKQVRSVKYKNGTIMIKESDEYAEDNTALFDPGDVQDVKVGPETIQFGPENEF